MGARILVTQEANAMLVKGDVKCLHCGFISGSWVGTSGAPLTISGFTAKGAERPSDVDGHRAIHCARCQGPVVLHEAERVLSNDRLRRIRRLRAQLASYDRQDEGFAA
jgi:hypothetical protein